MPEHAATPPASPAFLGDLPPNDFRAAAHAAVDWIADYLEHASQLPVKSRVQPGAIRAALPTSAPVTGEPLEAMLRDFRDTIMPGITHWNHRLLREQCLVSRHSR